MFAYQGALVEHCDTTQVLRARPPISQPATSLAPPRIRCRPGRRSRTRPASRAGGRIRPSWPGTPQRRAVPPMGSSAGGDVHACAGVHAAGDGARVFYDSQCHPFSLVEGVARTRWPPDLGTPASCTGRADQTGTPAGATLGPGRRIVSKTARTGVSRFGGQAGTQAIDLTPAPPQNRAGRAGSTTTSSLPIIRAWLGSGTGVVTGADQPVLVRGGIPSSSQTASRLADFIIQP